MSLIRRRKRSHAKEVEEATNAVRLITVKEAAEILGLSYMTVNNYGGGTSKLNRVRLGRAVRFVLADVIAFRDAAIKASGKD
jgi:predicted DNA-binding transcriptional regulator AlpA